MEEGARVSETKVNPWYKALVRATLWAGLLSFVFALALVIFHIDPGTPLWPCIPGVFAGYLLGWQERGKL